MNNIFDNLPEHIKPYVMLAKFVPGQTAGINSLTSSFSVAGSVFDKIRDSFFPSDTAQEKCEFFLPDFSIQLGKGLVNLLIKGESENAFLKRLVSLRKEILWETGFILPSVRITDNLFLKDYEYTLHFRGVEQSKGVIYPDRLLISDPPETINFNYSSNPLTSILGRPFICLNLEKSTEESHNPAFEVLQVITTHLKEFFAERSFEFLGRQETHDLLRIFWRRYPILIDELIPDKLTLSKVRKVLQSLLKEKVSIRNLLDILETLADWSEETQDVSLLTEHVRAALRRQISYQYKNQDDEIKVIKLEDKLENELSDSFIFDRFAKNYSLPADLLKKIIPALKNFYVKKLKEKTYPILLADFSSRHLLKSAFEQDFPLLVVLSKREIIPEIKLIIEKEITGAKKITKRRNI